MRILVLSLVLLVGCAESTTETVTECEPIKVTGCDTFRVCQQWTQTVAPNGAIENVEDEAGWLTYDGQRIDCRKPDCGPEIQQVTFDACVDY